ncbi:hypothetical protein D9M68_645200 [compost metagenome]
MMLVIQRERPKALDRRQLPRSEGNLVPLTAVQLNSLGVHVGIEVLRFDGPVVEHVRLRRTRPIEVIYPGLGIVYRAVPVVASRRAIVLPLEKRRDHLFLRFLRDLHQRFLDGRVLCCGGHHRAELRVHGLFARKRRHHVEHLAELIEEPLRNHPAGFSHAGAVRGGVGDVGSRLPVDGLHLAVEVFQRIKDHLVDLLLDGLPVLVRVIHEDARNDVGQRCRAANNGLHALGLLAFPIWPHQQVEAGLALVGFAQFPELIGAVIIERIDPEPLPEIRHLGNDRLFVQ